MERLITTDSDWTKNWQTSIAVKITATVLYAVAILGFVVAIFLMRDAEDKLNRHYDENADRFALRTAQELYPRTTVSLQEAAAALQGDVARFGFDAIIISQDGQSVKLGSPSSDAIVIHRRLPAVPDGQGGHAVLHLTLYHHPTHSAVVSHRNALLAGTGAATLVFGIFLTWVILKFISGPIRDLINANKAVMQGDLTVRLNSGRQDEFGALAKFFDRMMDQILRELTERKQAEELVQESEKRYRTLFESASDAIFILEAEGEKAGTIVALNKTAADMHGYTVDELMHKNIQEIDTPESARNAPNLIRRILEGEWIKSEEVTHRRKNGTVFFAEISAGLLEVGDHKYILAFDRDIMERKKAEELILHTQQTLQTILSATPYGVVVIGMDKKVRSANKAALELMGYDSEEQIAGTICNRSFCPADENKCPIIDLHHTVNHAEKILIAKDGKRVPILKTVVPVEIDGEKVLLEAFIDITNQKHAEQKLNQYAMDLKQSNEDVLSFAYIVSHDLRAPLVSIKGFAGELQHALQDIESILDQCMPHLSEKERVQIATTYRKDVPEAMNFIKSSVGRMDGLISAVLVLSRLGHRELKPEPLNMTDITKSILSSLAHQIEQRKTVVTIKDLPTITADKLAMEQIMGNLLDNALKYLDPLREGKIDVAAEPNGEETVFHVIDNGRGIAQEDMHKVFEIFRRAGKQDVPGEGMGLAYVKTLVRRQGGRIWCESEPGKGTTFSFTIPLSQLASVNEKKDS